ncbi:MAG: hypothetical protein D4R66_05350 [Opitutales bacterium]|nr:MAG: hypothetical protein D4R66_05350 [Opitutales bacterium]
MALPLAHAQKKKGGLMVDATELPQLAAMPDAFPQILGTQIITPAYKFTKEDGVLEAAREISKMGSRIIKVDVAPGPQFAELITLPFTHYLIWYRSNNDWVSGLTPEMKRREYNAMYAFTKDLLTRRDAAGKTFFIGHWEGDWYLLPSMNPAGDAPVEATNAMIEWLNVRQEAVDAARREVPYARCRVYTYTEVNRVRDAMKDGKKRVVNVVLPKVNVDFVSYSAYDVQLKTGEEVRATLDYINQQLVPKANLPPKRVFIGECGLSWTACGGDGKVHEQKNREIFIKFLSWRPAMVLYWQFYNNEMKDNQQVGFWLVDNKNKKTPLFETFRGLYEQQEKLAKQIKLNARRLPTLEETATFTENWLTQVGH